MTSPAPRPRPVSHARCVRRARAGLVVVWLGWACTVAAFETAVLRGRLDDNPYATAASAAQAAQQARRTGDRVAQLEALVLGAMAYNLVGDSARAEPPLQEGLALAGMLGHRQAQALLLAVEGEVAGAAGQPERAIEAFTAALAAARDSRDADTLATVQYQYGWMLARTLNRHHDAAPLLEAAIRHFERTGNRARQAEVRSLSAVVHERLLDHERSQAERERALGLIDPARHRYLAATLLYEIGTDALGHEDAARAASALGRSAALSREIGDKIGLAFAESALADAELTRGHTALALTLAQRAREPLAAGGNVIAVALNDLTIATALAQQQDQNAWRYLKQASTALAAFDNHHEQRSVALATARINAAFGHYDVAYAAMQKLSAYERARYREGQTRLLTEMSLRYDTERREAENRQLKLADQLKDAELRTQRLQQMAMGTAVGILVLALVAGAALYRRQSRVKQRFHDLALRDELTGAPNRRAILAHAAALLATPRPPGQHGALAMLDLDHFKQINDRFGHDVGDQALRTFYAVAQATLRSGDMLGRFGGEEWLLVIPDAPPGAPEAAFRRLRSAMQATPVPGLPPERRVAFSMGVTRIRPGDSLAQALARCDAALYQAKAQGRDGIVGDETAPAPAGAASTRSSRARRRR